MTTGIPPEKDRNFVTALARGLDVLRAFRRNETLLSNADIAARTGLPKATVSRLTHTLCVLDYLVNDPGSGAYRLGPGVLNLGFGVLSGLEIGDRAAALMSGLRDGPNTYITCGLGERHRLEVIYVAVRRSHENVALALHVGSCLPLFRAAMGRAILVAMPAPECEAVLDLARADDPDGDSWRQKVLERARAEYAARGYVTGYGDWRNDVNAIAVPVKGPAGGQIYGLNVGGPSFRVTPEELEADYADRLIAVARTLSLTTS